MQRYKKKQMQVIAGGVICKKESVLVVYKKDG